MDYFEMERRRYSSSGGKGGLGMAGKITLVIRNLIIANLLVFLIQSILDIFFDIRLGYLFGFVPQFFIKRFFIWQIVTYMFLHGGIFHLFWNLLGLFMFGGDVERTMGSRNFLKFYIACGLFAAICTLIFQFNSLAPIIGASGAIFGVVTAFGMLFPERVITLLLFFVIPVSAKAKYVAIAFSVLTFFQSFLLGSSTGVAYFAHLGGIIFAFLYFKNILNIRSIIENPSEKISLWKPASKTEDDIPADVYISEEVDPILEKISREGIHSLSRKEKKILEKAKDKL
ncbi:MAG: rhomboid family intramembrane serine protease [Candidatus Auribacter fodinae]|jgi:membrane associated rhomboid family serine protease|uniref:Rhomboid family intramembrane serine protease n=1 Tax=Candidatus Auribacter fodinae TaxID=2093366 RepID=A0A3A4QZF5_9BACT|nr:MAG: rhomboid family intramembrane serine protease [Candidatus Auribacter fodinae]